MQKTAHENWSSRFAFLMAAIGSAVGLGNIWRFPFVAGENGGGAFILIYLVTTATIALPILIAEIMLGRMGGRSPIGSVAHLVQKNKKPRFWILMGLGGTLGAFVVLSYYSVIGGWALKYAILALEGSFEGWNANDSASAFSALTGSASSLVIWHSLFMAINISIIVWGVQKGIERAVITLMPLLFILLLGMVFYASGTPGFEKALHFIFNADFSKVSAQTFLIAVGQGFFSVSIALGAMMTYGAYLPKDENIPASALIIVAADTGVALLAGLAIFPLVFSFALEPGAGPGLIFVTVPLAFAQMDNGLWIGSIFFILLVVAAITSSISLIEPSVSWVRERFNLSRGITSVLVGATAWFLGLASVFSFNHWESLYPLSAFGVLVDKTVFDILDFTVVSWIQPAVGIMMALFVGWALSRDTVMQALGIRNHNTLWFRGWLFSIRILCPAAVGLIFISAIFPQLLSLFISG